MDVKTIIDEQILKGDRDRLEDVWHVSNLGTCLTGAYFERVGIEPDWDFGIDTRRIFAVGILFEEWYLTKLSEALGDVYDIETQETLRDDEKDLVGHPDAVIRQNNKIVDVLEIKTIERNGFYRLKRDGGAYAHHELQLFSYLKMLGHDKGQLVYINKANLDQHTVVVESDNEILSEWFIDETEKLSEAWELQEEPDPVLDLTKWQYQRCRWHSHCLELAGYEEIAVKSNHHLYRELIPNRYENYEAEGKKTPDRFKVCDISEYRRVCDEYGGLSKVDA